MLVFQSVDHPQNELRKTELKTYWPSQRGIILESDSASVPTAYTFYNNVLVLSSYWLSCVLLAAGMANQVHTDTKKQRMAQLLALSGDLASAYHRRFVGRTMDVLWEDQEADGRWSGLTDNYLRVLAASGENIHNRVLPVRLIDATSSHLDGLLAAEVQ